ncbi:hypothetical protein BP6252_00985 [Coleophoma cylindrospora]|uniref:Uncharacterized protein n=1 Tax=Coleophoma cylindrospora TaxID=1849047 RepID=A0A3D8SRL9_9HELO|nr:hypothetical protein BP6252_00985 [Coleophoma cylindrospora]
MRPTRPYDGHSLCWWYRGPSSPLDDRAVPYRGRPLPVKRVSGAESGHVEQQVQSRRASASRDRALFNIPAIVISFLVLRTPSGQPILGRAVSSQPLQALHGSADGALSEQYLALDPVVGRLAAGSVPGGAGQWRRRRLGPGPGVPVVPGGERSTSLAAAHNV